MKVAVTGSSGFIGSHLLTRLKRVGHEYLILKHNLSIEQITAELDQFKPDLIVHLASVFIAQHKKEDIDLLIDSNIRFSTYLFEAARNSKIKKFIIIGSSWQHLFEDELSSVNLYGALKNGLESIARYYQNCDSSSVVFLKLYDSYGKNDFRPKLIPYLLNAMKNKTEIEMSAGEQIVDFAHVDNIIDAILLSADWLEKNPKKFQDFSVSGGEPMPLRQLICLIEKISKIKLPIKWGAKPYREREVMQPWNKGIALPNYTPSISLEKGLSDLFEQGIKSDL